MAELTVYRLAFHSGFHLGLRGVNLEESGTHIPSDSLFAALVDAFVRSGGDADGFARPFREGDPPFLLTSAFPFAGSVLFFPMPVPLGRWFAPNTLRERAKDLKQVAFLSEGLFRQMLAGEQMDQRFFPGEDAESGSRAGPGTSSEQRDEPLLPEEGAEPARGVALQGGKFWLLAGEVKELPQQMRMKSKTRKALPLRALRHHRVYETQQVPRVTVDRISSASNIFHAGRVSFHPGCGLWFGICWRKPEMSVGSGGLSFRDAFRLALSVLADDGLGGERTVGYGGFRWEEFSPLELPDPEGNGLMWLLSRYHPREGELPTALTLSPGYTLTAVAGWLRTWHGAAQRRRRLWLVTEGSLVHAVGAGPWGDLTDVRPSYQSPAGGLPHPAWRYGLALGAGLKEVPDA